MDVGEKDIIKTDDIKRGFVDVKWLAVARHRRLEQASVSARGGETWGLHNDTECLDNFSVTNWW